MPIIPLFGHDALLRRLQESATHGTLPASLLLHGPAGVGKQRLAIELARTLLCVDPAGAPCDQCQSCRFALELTHPDLHWYFPRERLKGDPSVEDVAADLAEGVANRAERHGLYDPTPGNFGIFVNTIHALVRRAALSPAISRRKVFIVGDAERMVSQASSPEAANAFLKLLEEPPSDTTVIITSSEPGALLPTVRSRVAAVRVAPLGDDVVRRFVEHDDVRSELASRRKKGAPPTPPDDELVRLAGGRPGRLLGGAEDDDAAAAARRLLDAAGGSSRARRIRTGYALGPTGARAGFSSMLEQLTMLLHQRMREAVELGDDERAAALSRAVDAVEEAGEWAQRNVNPQLAGTRLLARLSLALRG